MGGARGAAAVAPEGGWGLHAALKRRFVDEVFGAVTPRVADRGTELVCDGAGMRQVQALWKVHELTKHGVPACNVLTPGVRRQPLPHNAVIYLIAHSPQSADLVCADWEPAPRRLPVGPRPAAGRGPPPYAEAHVFFVDDVPRGSETLKRIARCRELAPHIKSMKELRMSFSCPEPHLFTLLPHGASSDDVHGSMQRLFPLPGRDPRPRQQEAERVARGIADVLEMLGDCPMVRHQAVPDPESTCRTAGIVAGALEDVLSARRRSVDPSRQQGTVLILDRSIDLASPLLHDLHVQSLMMDVMPSEPISCPVDTPGTARLLVLPPHPHRPAHQLVCDMAPNSRGNNINFDDAEQGMTVCMSPSDDPQQKRYLCTVVDKHNLRGGYASIGGTNLTADPSALSDARERRGRGRASAEAAARGRARSATPQRRAPVEAKERHAAAAARGAPPGGEGTVLVKWARPGDGGPASAAAGGQKYHAVRRDWWEGDGAATKAYVFTLDDSVELWCRLRHQHLNRAIRNTVPKAVKGLRDITEWRKLQAGEMKDMDIAALRRAFAGQEEYRYERVVVDIFAHCIGVLHMLWRPWEDMILFEQDLACREDGALYALPDNCPVDARKRLDWLLAQDLRRDLLTEGRTCSAFRGAPAWAQRHDLQTRVRLLLLYFCCKGVPTEEELGQLQEILRGACSQHAHVPPPFRRDVGGGLDVPLPALVAALQAFDVSAAKETSIFQFVSGGKDKRKRASKAAVKVEKDPDGGFRQFVPAVKTLAEQLLAGDGAADGLPLTEYPYTSEGAGRGRIGPRPPRRPPRDGDPDVAESLAAAEGPRHYVFVVGGLSYCESRAVAEVVAERGRAVIVGTTAMLTPAAYVDGLTALGMTQGGATVPAP